MQLGELQRRRSRVEAEARGQVLGLVLVLEIERWSWSIEEMKALQAANAQRLAVIEVGYKFGRGSTVEMMALWQAAEAEKVRIGEVERDRMQAIRKLAGLTGYGDEMDSSSSHSRIAGATFSQSLTPGATVSPVQR